MSSRLPTDEALEKEDRIDEIKKQQQKTKKQKKKKTKQKQKKNNKKKKKHSPSIPHLLQAQQAPAASTAGPCPTICQSSRTIRHTDPHTGGGGGCVCVCVCVAGGGGSGWHLQISCWTNYVNNREFLYQLFWSEIGIFVRNIRNAYLANPLPKRLFMGLTQSTFYLCFMYEYLFIFNHWVQIFKFLSNLYVETNGNGTKLLRQLLTIKLILLLIVCSEISALASNI